jgi:PTH1 family peptidyl-tRNA hydrolase
MGRFAKLRHRGLKPLEGARLIVGLGNPGADYSQHRHNAGMRSVEHLRKMLRLPQPERESRYRVSQAATVHGPVAVVIPRTFMNESGKAVQSLLDKYRAEPSDLILLVDELDLEPGRIRIRASGSDAGQRGMRSIRSVIGELDFPRIRIGVGRPMVDGKGSHHPDDVADWLLSDPSPAERRLLFEAEQRAAEAVVHMLEHGVESAMNLYNRNLTTAGQDVDVESR